MAWENGTQNFIFIFHFSSACPCVPVPHIPAYNACTLVPTVFRWNGKMEFKCRLHFSFSHDIEKQIWILLFVFRFRLTLKNGFELRISFFVFASLWKTGMNFSFRFRITLKNGFEFHFSFLHYLLLKNRLEFRLSFLHEFEKWINTPVIWNSPPPPPQGDDRDNEGPFTS